MKKTPYTLSLLVPTLSPAANINIYEDGRTIEPLFSGHTVKMRDHQELMDREVKHIHFKKEKDTIFFEIFVY